MLGLELRREGGLAARHLRVLLAQALNQPRTHSVRNDFSAAALECSLDLVAAGASFGCDGPRGDELLVNAGQLLFGDDTALGREDLLFFLEVVDGGFRRTHLHAHFLQAAVNQAVRFLGLRGFCVPLIFQVGVSHGLRDVAREFRCGGAGLDVDDVGLLGALDLDALVQRLDGLDGRLAGLDRRLRSDERLHFVDEARTRLDRVLRPLVELELGNDTAKDGIRRHDRHLAVDERQGGRGVRPVRVRQRRPCGFADR